MARTRQAKPTKQEIRDAWRTLKQFYAHDPYAAAALIFLNQSQPAEISTPTAVRLAATAAAYLPRSDWHALPEDVAELADAMLNKMVELVAKEKEEAAT